MSLEKFGFPDAGCWYLDRLRSFVIDKGSLGISIEISLCTAEGTSYRVFVTIFAENHLMSSFNPIFVISVRTYIFNGTKSKL